MKHTHTARLLINGSALRLLKTSAGIAIGFLMMPFLINNLGSEMYGLWVIIGSVVSSYYLLDLGFSQAVTRFVSKSIHQDDALSANKIINTALVIYCALGLLILLVSTIFAFYGADSLIKNKENLTIVQVLLIISGISLAVEFPAKAFPGIISAYLRYDTLALVGLVKIIIDAVLIYFFISNGFGLIALSLIGFFTGLASTLFFVWYSTSLFKEMKLKKSLVDMKTAQEVYHFSKWVFVIDICRLIKTKMDIWLIAYFSTLSLVTLYYVAVRLVDYAIQFLSQATGITGPLFTKFYAKNDYESLSKAVVLFLKINIFLGSLIIAGFYLVGEDFIRFWMGAEFEYSTAYQCLLILAIGRMVTYFTEPLNSLLLTLNEHSFTAKLSIVEAALSVLLGLYLIPDYSLVGAALSISIPLVISRIFIFPIYSFKRIQVKKLALAGHVISFNVVLAVIIIVIGNMSLLGAVDGNLLTILVKSCVVMLATCVAGLCLFSKNEILFVVNKLKSSTFSKKIGA